MSDATRILQAIEQGDPTATEKLIPLVYDELRKLAASRLRQEVPGQTLSATALVHEVFLRLLGGDPAGNWNSKAHFFGAAAEAMRRILIENARSKKRIKRGGALGRVDLESGCAIQPSPPEDLADDIVALDLALEQFGKEEPVAAQVVKLRYFAGLTIAQTAEALSISVRTANRHWEYAKAWLFDFLRDSDGTQ